MKISGLLSIISITFNNFEELLNTIRKEGRDILVNVSLFDVYQSGEVGDSNKSVAFSLTYQSEFTTLTDLEVDQNLDIILNSLNQLHGAIQR